MTTMIFQAWNPSTLKWDIILTETYPTFTEALKASDKKWDELFPLQKQGQHFHCILR